VLTPIDVMSADNVRNQTKNMTLNVYETTLPDERAFIVLS